MALPSPAVIARIAYLSNWILALFCAIPALLITVNTLFYPDYPWKNILDVTLISVVSFSLSIVFFQEWVYEDVGINKLGRKILHGFGIAFFLAAFSAIAFFIFKLIAGKSISVWILLFLDLQTNHSVALELKAISIFFGLVLSLFFTLVAKNNGSHKHILQSIAGFSFLATVYVGITWFSSTAMLYLITIIYLFITFATRFDNNKYKQQILVMFWVYFGLFTLIWFVSHEFTLVILMIAIFYSWKFVTSKYNGIFSIGTVINQEDIQKLVVKLLENLLITRAKRVEPLGNLWFLSMIALLVIKAIWGLPISWLFLIGLIVVSFVILVTEAELERQLLLKEAISSFEEMFAYNANFYRYGVSVLQQHPPQKTANTLINNVNQMTYEQLLAAVSMRLPYLPEDKEEFPFDIHKQTNDSKPTPDSENQSTESRPMDDNTFPFQVSAVSKQAESNPSSETTQANSPATGLLKTLSDRETVRLAYANEIQNIASVLKVGLSALVSCDKLVVESLWQEIVTASGLNPKLLQISDVTSVQSTLLHGQLNMLRKYIESFKRGEVLVVPHLDLIAGGSSSYATDVAREFTELVYRASDNPILAFTDVSMEIPEVVASRFSIRRIISGVPRTVMLNGKEVLLAQALITSTEANRIEKFNPEDLYKTISGMNPVQIRHAIAYALHSAKSNPMPMEEVYQSIRVFKTKTSANFEIPDVSFDDIGGYENVKLQLFEAINLLEGAYQLPNEKLRKELIPRGFIFHGKPGTGKTLFAKALANRLNATVMVVSGPETLDKWLGESERKVREIFADARRNAPSVLIFDEFDAIASKRTGDSDGGSRAINSMVAQILTEMDGFRPDVPMLVIGTTNRIDIIDEAFLRPSRFHAISIDLPDKQARRSIAQIHASHFDIEVPAELLDVIAETTAGFNGDEIHSIFRDACIGMYKKPSIPADGFRIGQLVGVIRRNKAVQKGGSIMIPL